METAEPTSAMIRSLRAPIVVVAAAAIVLAYVEAIHGFLALIAFSALAGILARHLHLALQRRGLGRKLALTLTTLAYVVILAALAAAAIASVIAVADLLVDQSDGLQADLAALADAFASATGLPPGSVPSVDTAVILSALRGVLGTVAPAVTGLAMSVLIVIYLLMDADNLRARMLRGTSADSVARYDAMSNELAVYIRVRAVLGAAAAVADVILLLVLGVPYAVLWGVVSFLFSFVPNLGFLLALVPPTVFAYVELGLGPAIAVVAGYVVINLAFDYVLQPRVMSASLDLSPVVVIVSILAWTVIIGPAGALLAVPLTIALRVLLVPFDGARWFVALLGPVPGDPAPVDAPPVEAGPGDSGPPAVVDADSIGAAEPTIAS
jgi:predicted PurR-regulated permease PerM